jgi:hypothetical protein
MISFDEKVTQHQIKWRRANIASGEWGWYKSKQYEHILPEKIWEEGLWCGIRSGSSNSLPEYLRINRIQKHRSVADLKSSWVLCANLYFPFRSSNEGRILLAEFLGEQVNPEIRSVDAVELEYAESGQLHPSRLLGEHGGARGAGQTSPDIAFWVNGRSGLILTENKFLESSFYDCSARRTTDKPRRPGNPDPTRCDDVLAILKDPARQCHQSAWGRKYWDYLAPALRREMLLSLRGCPAAHAGYQLFRQQALAEGIATSEKYDFVVSSVAIDERNEKLSGCLARVGITDIRQWGKLFRGKAEFAVFTHQQWITWVYENGDPTQWADWLGWMQARYGLLPARGGDAERR